MTVITMLLGISLQAFAIDDESIYNKYNKIIRMFLDSQFGVETADILEDWVFGYDKDNRPSFDDVWYNIIND